MQEGGVRCWGANTFGLLGDGTTADRATPPGTDVLSGVAAVSVGFSHACAVTTAGGLRCWGGNAGGQLGNGTVVGTLTPPSTDLLAGVRDVAAGASFTCALMASGGVRCWGYNGDGQIGDDTPNSTERMTPPTTDILTDVAALAVGNAHVCARMKSGGIRCWGGHNLGQLGDGLAPDLAAAPPPQDIVQFEGTCR
jgi:alpha-tubulin suppressor-like RCC1 family protein